MKKQASWRFDKHKLTCEECREAFPDPPCSECPKPGEPLPANKMVMEIYDILDVLGRDGMNGALKMSELKALCEFLGIKSDMLLIKKITMMESIRLAKEKAAKEKENEGSKS